MTINVEHAPTEKADKFCELINEIRILESCVEQVTLEDVERVCNRKRNLLVFTPHRGGSHIAIHSTMASFDAGQRLAIITIA